MLVYYYTSAIVQYAPVRVKCLQRLADQGRAEVGFHLVLGTRVSEYKESPEPSGVESRETFGLVGPSDGGRSALDELSIEVDS